MIRPATPIDSLAIASLYNHYVLNSHATFEEIPVTSEDMAMRIERILADSLPWLVMEDNGNSIGFARALPWRERSAYRFSVETSIYLSPACTGKGQGFQLYSALLSRLKALGVHAVMAGIALPNPASVALHHKLGYKKVAHFKEVGWKFDRWIDVEYWELLIVEGRA